MKIVDISTKNPKVQVENFHKSQIDIIHSSDLSFESFFQNYLIKNEPCLIKSTTNSWKCNSLWIKEGKEINFEYLREKYGNEIVPVANCSEKYYNAQRKNDEIFQEYLDYLKSPDVDSLLYLKDWHLQRKFLDRDKFYFVPEYFVSDWLNEYSIGVDIDDYRFVYIGPKKTWTPFHADVFTSYSWSVNVFGRKRWLLFPPQEEEKLKDQFGALPYDCEVELKQRKNCRFYEIFQEAGDAIFVPSGWHHQVWNLETTISINHNWINGCNIDIVYGGMIKCFVDVKQEISDCQDMKGWDDQCQKMLKAIFGMDFKDFYEFIVYIANERLNFLNNGIEVKIFDDWAIGENLAYFDLKQIKNILYKFKNYFQQCESLLKEIDDIL